MRWGLKYRVTFYRHKAWNGASLNCNITQWIKVMQWSSGVRFIWQVIILGCMHFSIQSVLIILGFKHFSIQSVLRFKLGTCLVPVSSGTWLVGLVDCVRPGLAYHAWVLMELVIERAGLWSVFARAVFSLFFESYDGKNFKLGSCFRDCNVCSHGIIALTLALCGEASKSF